MNNDEQQIQELMDQRDACERAFEHITRAMEIFDTIEHPVSPLWFGLKANIFGAMERLSMYNEAVNEKHATITGKVK